MKEFLVNNSDLIVAICAIVVSIVSIIIGVRYNRKTFKYQKKHDKLTTEPHLGLNVVALRDKYHLIEILNNGFGPCHIKSIKYIFKNKEYTDITRLYRENFNELIGNLLPNDSLLLNLGKSENIGVGKSLVLLKLTFKKGYDVRHFVEFLKQVKIIITYTNIYKDERIHEEILMGEDAFTGVNNLIK